MIIMLNKWALPKKKKKKTSPIQFLPITHIFGSITKYPWRETKQNENGNISSARVEGTSLYILASSTSYTSLCTSWRAITIITDKKKKQKHQVPLLLLSVQSVKFQLQIRETFFNSQGRTKKLFRLAFWTDQPRSQTEKSAGHLSCQESHLMLGLLRWKLVRKIGRYWALAVLVNHCHQIPAKRSIHFSVWNMTVGHWNIE